LTPNLDVARPTLREIGEAVAKFKRIKVGAPRKSSRDRDVDDRAACGVSQ